MFALNSVFKAFLSWKIMGIKQLIVENVPKVLTCTTTCAGPRKRKWHAGLYCVCPSQPIRKEGGHRSTLCFSLPVNVSICLSTLIGSSGRLRLAWESFDRYKWIFSTDPFFSVQSKVVAVCVLKKTKTISWQKQMNFHYRYLVQSKVEWKSDCSLSKAVPVCFFWRNNNPKNVALELFNSK